MSKYLAIKNADFSGVSVENVNLKDTVKVLGVVSPVNSGLIQGDGFFGEGEDVTIEAIPIGAYVFKKWADGIATTERSFKAVGKIIKHTALFEEYPLTKLKWGNTGGSEVSEFLSRHNTIPVGVKLGLVPNPSNKYSVYNETSGTYSDGWRIAVSQEDNGKSSTWDEQYSGSTYLNSDIIVKNQIQTIYAWYCKNGKKSKAPIDITEFYGIVD